RVYGRLSDAGWGSALGFPGLVLDPRGTAIDVSVFDSQELADHWSRLDEFEGDGYRRVMTDVQTDEGFLAAYIYVLATADRQ
ncbi:MAG TPA: gamma-glutamylcyclotransferase, partial [Terracidiphilus sp.]|nr:gamma-glutamylcyclotransferase [Terracidiphilus sp.]